MEKRYYIVIRGKVGQIGSKQDLINAYAPDSENRIHDEDHVIILGSNRKPYAEIHPL